MAISIMDSDNFENEDYQPPFGAMNPNGMMNPYYLDLQGNYIPAPGMVAMNQSACNCHLMPWNYDYVQNSFYDGLVNTSYAYNPMSNYANANGMQNPVAQAQSRSKNGPLSDSNGLNDSNNSSLSKIQRSDQNNDAAQPASENDAIQKAVEEYQKENQPLYLESISANFIKEENDDTIVSPPLSALLEQQETASTSSEIDTPPTDASTTHSLNKRLSSTYPNGSRMNMFTFTRSRTVNNGQSSPTGHEMENNVTSAPRYVDVTSDPENCARVIQEPGRTCATARDEWNQTYTETSFSGTLPPARPLGNTWGGNAYYNDYTSLNMVRDNVTLGKLVYRQPKMYPFGDGYVPYSQELLYSCNNVGADAHKHNFNMTAPYADAMQMHALSHASTENPSAYNMANFDFRGYPPSAAYSYRDQHLDYNHGKPIKCQNNGNIAGLSEHTMMSNLPNASFIYPNHGTKEPQLDDCNLSNINLHEIDFINMSDKTWLTLRSAGMFKLGNKGRAILKSKISKQLKTNSQMRMRASLISGVRRATTRQLFQLAQICGIKSHLK